MKSLKSIVLDKEPLIGLMTVNGHPNLLSMVGMQVSFKIKNCSISCSEILLSVRCSSNMSICFFLHCQVFLSRGVKLGWEVFRLTCCSFIGDNLRRKWWQTSWLAFWVNTLGLVGVHWNSGFSTFMNRTLEKTIWKGKVDCYGLGALWH